MIIAGAGNLGKHILDQLIHENYAEEIIFFDDSAAIGTSVYNKYPIIKNTAALTAYFNTSGNKFIVAVGHPRIREKVTKRILNLGGALTKILSAQALISTNAEIGVGSVIQPGCCVSHNTRIGVSSIIHAHTLIGHDVSIGDYFTCGSNANILSPTTIGHFCTIGANTLFWPGNTLGDYVFVGAGAIVSQSLKDYETFVGR